MPDPVLVGSAAIIAYLSKDGLNKLLGPTADYVGGEVKSLVEKSQKNLFRIFFSAEKKLNKSLELPGTVNPRVFKQIYDEGRFCEDPLVAEYFAGVLASSRTKDGTDDRGLYFINIVKTLSSYQLRMHYLTYYLISRIGKLFSYDLNLQEVRNNLQIVIPFEAYKEIFSVIDVEKEHALLTHALSGLASYDLIAGWGFYSPGHLKYNGRLNDEYLITLSPDVLGIQLFLWVHCEENRQLNWLYGLDLRNPLIDVGDINKYKLTVIEGSPLQG